MAIRLIVKSMTTTLAEPTKSLRAQLDDPYSLSPQQIERFRRDGYIKLKHVLSPEVIDYYGREISRQVVLLNEQTKPMSERTTYEKAFLQISNIWTKSDVVKEFAFSRRLARIAAELMGVKGVRMYHDQALYKEPGGGITPWHADQYYWPVSNNNTVTAWIPLQATPLELGPLAFSIGSHQFEMGRDLEISDDSEKKIQRSLKDHNYPLDESAFDLGEVSFHYGWTFHRAAPNTSDRARAVMTVIYMEDGIRVIEPKRKAHVNDIASWMPGTPPGEIAATPLNPVLYRAD
jgi:ectoine hydroxylase-related dioxygenase (phytanoyl-CoA dioxygenase family)